MDVLWSYFFFGRGKIFEQSSHLELFFSNKVTLPLKKKKKKQSTPFVKVVKVGFYFVS